MRLYNTMSRQLDDFEPGPVVSLYVCGVTPYDTTHLGHAFSYASFDVLIRFLRYLGYEVRYTQNVTDIDDDILRKAREVGVPWDQLGQEQTAQFQRDMAALNILPPTHYPRATQEIPGMIVMIQQLLDNGHAYIADHNVYFATRTAQNFGALSRLPEDAMLARFEETGDSPQDPRKRDRLDFVLWKESAPGEPSWDAPWGAGRPGWHIECSTMATHYLGPCIDIHGGGDDLIFPHHSCEIAQSEEATGCVPFARIWMHNGAVQMDGIKMSKSLGNLVMVRELVRSYTPDALRLYLHQHHYRESFEYNAAELDASVHLAATLARRAETTESLDQDQPLAEVQAARRRIVSALADDLDTPRAVEVLAALADLPGEAARTTMIELGGILGLQFTA
jgi:L-cysteine:1D-myo-inositol 2-amino-2-deoxy-alpha-D-glucopyranoside ligase